MTVTAAVGAFMSQNYTADKKPKLLDQVRSALRTKHYSLRTEEAYLHWIKRFILFHNKRHPRDMGEKEINQFLTHLAVNENEMNDPTISGDGQTVWLYVYVGGFEHEQWSKDIEDYSSYQKVELKDANGGSNVYTTTYYNNSNYTENKKVKFKIEAFVCVGGHGEETRLEKTFESKEFEIPRKDPLIYIARSEVDFGAGSGSETESHAFEVENHGADPLSWSATDDKRWIEFSPPFGGSGEYVDVTVNRNNIAQEDLDEVNHSGTISFSGNGGTEFVTVKAAIVAPSTPQNLTITNAGIYNQSPHLTWDAVDLVYRYKIYRKPYSGGSWQQIGTARSNSYTDYEVVMQQEGQADDQFYYQVKASNGAGDSGYSNIVSTWGFTMQKKNPDDKQMQLELASQLVSEYKLENSYPNPGNPGTTITFQLPEAGQVSLKVINIRGEVIRTLVRGEKSAGVHEVYWDGYSDQGNSVSTGIYIFVLRAGGKVFHKKYSLVK